MRSALKFLSGGLILCCVVLPQWAADIDDTAALLAKTGKASAAKSKLSKEEIRQLIILHSEFSSTRPVTHEQRLDIVRALTAQFGFAPRECISTFNGLLAAETSLPAQQFVHRFIAACYENLPAPDREKAAQHLLSFADLRYGKDSDRYAYFLQLKEKGALNSSAYLDLFRFDAAYAQSKIHLAYWNMKDGDSRLQSLGQNAESKKQIEAVLQENYASGLSHLSTILGKEQRSHRKFIELHAALYQRLAVNYYKLARYDTCLENIRNYVALLPIYAKDMTALKVWLACADKTIVLNAESTDFAQTFATLNGRKQLLENLRQRIEVEKDEKTKKKLEKILRGDAALEENELESWQLPGFLFGDRP